MKNIKVIFVWAVFVLVLVGLLFGAFYFIKVRLAERYIKEHDATAVSNISKIQQALENYYDTVAYYPNTLDDLVTAGVLEDVPFLAERGKGEYVYVPLGENQICTGYHLGVVLSGTNRDFLLRDKDYWKRMVCSGATSKDFEGASVDCGDIKVAESKEKCYDVGV